MSDECQCLCKFDECITSTQRMDIIVCLHHKKQINCSIKTSIKIILETHKIPMIIPRTVGIYSHIIVNTSVWLCAYDDYGFIRKLLSGEEKQQKLLEYNKKLKDDIQCLKNKIDLLNA